MAVEVFILQIRETEGEERHTWAWILFLVCILSISGGYLFFRAVFRSKGGADHTAEKIGSAHWSTRILIIMGAPLYVVLKAIEGILRMIIPKKGTTHTGFRRLDG